jgi:hypothetical protein
MPFTNAAKNTMLDAIGITHASVHSAFPSTTGANEVSGGAYVRKAASFSAAAAGDKALSAAMLFDVAAGTTAAWIGAWTAVTAGTFLGYSPNGLASASDVKEYTADVATDFITSPAHGLADTTTIVFYGGTPPGGLTEGTTYFVRDSTTNTFKVAATSGGVAIDLTSTGDNKCVVSKIVIEVFAGAGQVNVTTFTQSLNLG